MTTSSLLDRARRHPLVPKMLVTAALGLLVATTSAIGTQPDLAKAVIDELDRFAPAAGAAPHPAGSTAPLSVSGCQGAVLRSTPRTRSSASAPRSDCTIRVHSSSDARTTR